MKQKFNIITSTCVPLPLENVDTDQIIPARFLKATTREGFGENLFRDWRYNPDGSVNKDFVLNNPTYGGEILVAGKISVPDRAGNTPLGPSPITDFGLSYRVFLPIFTKTTNSTISYSLLS